MIEIESLDLLRNLVKRDPEAYREEFAQQLLLFESILQIVKIRDFSSKASMRGTKTKEFTSLIDFLSHVAPYFPVDCTDFPAQLIDLLENFSEHLGTLLRKSVVKALILLRNRQFVPSLTILPVFFRLFRVADKNLRSMVFTHIVQDIIRINLKNKNNKLNSSLQNYMFKVLKDKNPTVVRKSLGVMIELYRKNVWKTAKTVNVISTACFSPHSAVIRQALRFFMGEMSNANGEDEDDDVKDIKSRNQTIMKIRAGMKGTKRKNKRRRIIKREQDKIKKAEENGPSKSINQRDFSAIRSLNDPQSFAERLFGSLRRSKETFETRILLMNVISRLIGSHELLLFNFYPFLQRYMQPHQINVTKILSYLAQACHEMIPPEILLPCVKALLHNFVTDRSSPEVIAVGINTIREICVRQPLVMDSTLLQDLTQYKSSRDKGVAVAARSLIGFFRTENPDLLVKKDRGKPTDSINNRKVQEFGVRKQEVSDGASFLFASKAREKAVRASKRKRQNDDTDPDSDSDAEWDESNKKRSINQTDSGDESDDIVVLNVFDEKEASSSDSENDESKLNLSLGDVDVIADDKSRDDAIVSEMISSNSQKENSEIVVENQSKSLKITDIVNSSKSNLPIDDVDIVDIITDEKSRDDAIVSEMISSDYRKSDNSKKISDEPQFADELPIEIPDFSDSDNSEDNNDQTNQIILTSALSEPKNVIPPNEQKISEPDFFNSTKSEKLFSIKNSHSNLTSQTEENIISQNKISSISSKSNDKVNETDFAEKNPNFINKSQFDVLQETVFSDNDNDILDGENSQTKTEKSTNFDKTKKFDNYKSVTFLRSTEILKRKPLPASALKILTPRDHKQIEQLRLEKALKNARKRGESSITVVPHASSSRITSEFSVDENDIHGVVYVQHRNLEERLSERKEKQKYEGRQKGGGTTNEDKNRKKNFKLVKYSKQTQNKRNRSQHQKSTLQKKHSERMKLGHRRKYKKKKRT